MGGRENTRCTSAKEAAAVQSTMGPFMTNTLISQGPREISITG